MKKNKVHRGTLHEMIKNDANKCAKQIETKAAVTAPMSIRQQSSEVDNRHALASMQKTTNKYHDVDDNNESAKQLSKLDLIKKFDSKFKQPETVDNKQSHRSSYEDSQKLNTVADEVENDENIQNSNNEQTIDVEIRSPANESESSTVANNNYKNGNTYGGNANGNETIPPKPLPRTSRNNSISSLSSEHSISIANPIEEFGRPVAKPRTSTTSYKVQHHPNFTLVLHRFRFRLICIGFFFKFLFLYWILGSLLSAYLLCFVSRL